jgi:hypothetical protein
MWRKGMSEYVWETFDSLFKTVHRQGRIVAELENRISALERRLEERAEVESARESEMPAEKAA